MLPWRRLSAILTASILRLGGLSRDYFARVDQLGVGNAADAGFPQLDLNSTLKEDLVDHLVELRRAAECAAADEERDQDDEFYATQSTQRSNVKRYYRKMLSDGRKWWNLRNRQLAEMINDLAEKTVQLKGKSKVVVWAHQFLVGDAEPPGCDSKGSRAPVD